jgi:FAD/FMN-containing dehydrogenase
MAQVQLKDVAESGVFIDNLIQQFGRDRVLHEPEDVTFFSTDIFSAGVTAEAVIRPADIDQLSRAIAFCTEHDRAVVPRGGGLSYTAGYIPTRSDTVMVDLRDLNRIIEINTEDMYVTVECGCTWRELYDALKAKGVRTPYFGPMSGYWSTVGGALSQGSIFLGSTQYGTTADSVLGLQVVLADGTVVTTGSAAGTIAPSPFFRNFGPDLTGLFLGDTGALGFKARATLKLIPFPEHQRYGAFAHDNIQDCIKILTEIGRGGLAAECYCWDPYFVMSLGQRTNTLQGVKFLAGIVRSGSTWMDGLKSAARVAMAGRSVLDGSTYIVNVVIDDVTEAGAEAKLKLVQEIAARHGAGEIEAAAPRATRGQPFTDFKSAELADQTLRNLPTHGIAPLSRAPKVAAEIHAYFKEQDALFKAHDIKWGIICFAIGNNAIIIEPLYFWNDDKHRLNNRYSEKSDVVKLAAFKGEPEVNKAVDFLRQGLKDIFKRNGCVHLQIGKAYPYRDTRQPETFALLERIKHSVDPQGLVNPGSLGLD